MVPDLFRSLQNLHPQRLQKGKPRSFAVVLLVLAAALISVAELGVLAGILVSDLEVLGSKKSVMFLFFLKFRLVKDVVEVATGAVVGGLYDGSSWLSAGRRLTLARTSKSLRFFGLL